MAARPSGAARGAMRGIVIKIILSLHNVIFLFFAGALGGAINTVAGGNKLKVILGGVINGVATLTFIATGMILWPLGIVMTVGAILGGYSSAHYAQKLPQAWVRAFVILVGTAMKIYFFIRGYR